MKNFVALVLALMMLLSCSAMAEETYEVGILQLVQHEALDQATQGFIDTLTAKLGDKVKFDVQNASGDTAACTTIATTFTSDEVNLIMANATPAVQAAMNATADIPVVGTSVTVYNFLEGATNVTGTSDLAPLDGQAQMILELFPETKTVGMLYCSAEANSVYQVEAVAGYLKELGVEAKEYPFADSNDVASVAQLAADDVDVIYIPTDNTAAAYTETIANVVIPAKVPVVAGEAGICSGCGVATLSIDYYDLGYETGNMAAQILTGKADISTMPVKFAPNVTKMYNAANCTALGVQIPDGYVVIE